MSRLSLLLYIPLQVLFIPMAIVGVVLVAYKQMVVSKRLGVSQTAIEVINGRWTMHVFGMREDEATTRLAATLPNTSLLGVWLVLFPLWVKYKLSGEVFLYPRRVEQGSETLGELVIARTLYFDRVIERVLGDVGQVVLLGAGYDTRAYGPFRREGIVFFELDQESVQDHKRIMTARAGIDTTDVRFVAVDFSEDDVFEKLAEAGYDPVVKTIFLWEGVTLYLKEEAVRKAMRQVRTHSAPGSVLLADIYADRMIKMGKSATGSKALDYTNEGFGFGLPFSAGHEAALSRFVESEALTVGETFFMGSVSDKGPFMVMVEMVV